jgi:hypothetical protein
MTEQLPIQINLEDLFNDLNPLITQTTNRIAYLYRHKWPADFEDIQQLVRLDVWKFLPKLLTLATSKDSLTRLVVTAINYSFKSHYRNLRKKNNYASMNNSNTVVITSSIDELHDVGIDTAARTEALLDLGNVQSEVLRRTVEKNRWTGDEQSAVNYCIITMLHGREPSRKVLKVVYGVTKGMYLIHYSRTLLKICVLQMMRRTRDTLRDTVS